MTIYFNRHKQAFAYKIDDYLCTVDDNLWNEFCILKLGVDYDVDENGIIDLRQTPEYIAEQLAKAKDFKFAENTEKAKQAIENGYVTFKDAEFETNAQTVGDLTATMLMIQSSGINFYEWLSRDDKVVELSVEDFITLGSLIANFKNIVWNEKYIDFKIQIEECQTVEEVNTIDINYED